MSEKQKTWKVLDTWKVWAVSRGETEDDAETIHSDSAQEAAEIWAQRDDLYSGEYDIVAQRDEPVVEVKSEAGVVTRWQVLGEAEPVYWAREV